jgi:membrane protease YdiL (CAAX protease family)
MLSTTTPELKKGLNVFWACAITSSLFAIAHLQVGSGEPLLWSAAVDTFVLSLILIYLREKTGSLWTSVGLHSLKNFIAFLGLFVFHWV